MVRMSAIKPDAMDTCSGRNCSLHRRARWLLHPDSKSGSRHDSYPTNSSSNLVSNQYCYHYPVALKRPLEPIPRWRSCVSDDPGEFSASGRRLCAAIVEALTDRRWEPSKLESWIERDERFMDNCLGIKWERRGNWILTIWILIFSNWELMHCTDYQKWLTENYIDTLTSY